MKTVAAALGFLVIAVAPAHAADFECAWRALPSNVRAAFTRDLRTSNDIQTALDSGVLTEPLLREIMGPCNVTDGEAAALGQYVAARALAAAQRSRLIVTHGWHESQFAALMATVTPADRDVVFRSAGGEPVATAETAGRFRSAVQAQGVSSTDEATLRVGMDYMYAQIIVERLAPAMRP